MQFWYKLPKKKRSAYNSKILRDAIDRKSFVVPEAKY